MLNFLLVPIYTRVLVAESYGVYSEIMAWVTLLQVVLAFGLETGFFRFANRSNQDVNILFSTILLFLFVTSLLAFLGIYALSGAIAEMMGYYKRAIVFIAAILAIDSFTSILFARLRHERKAIKFATFRIIKIFSEILFNLLFIFVFPIYLKSNPDTVFLKILSPVPDYSYILAAILCSCIVSLILFIPTIIRTSFKFSGKTMKAVLIYSLPLMIAGLPGVANDTIDKILYRFIAPESDLWNTQLGIYSANVKLAVIILLFIQMFRYAAEPFFFSSANQPDIKKVYANIMKYFTAFCMIIFVFIVMYLDVIGLILGKDFRSGVEIVPIMLLANVLMGVNMNLAMWYKLSEKTNIAILITLSGFAATILINLVFVPYYGYYAAVAAHLISYLVMIVISYWISLKHYRIPYQWSRITLFIVSGIFICLASLVFLQLPMAPKLAINTILLLIYMLFIGYMEKINVLQILQRLGKSRKI